MKLEETKTQEVSKPENNKDNKAKDKKGFGNWVAAHKAEFRKIVWPTKQEIIRETAIVLVLCFLIGAIIFGMDTVISYGYDALVSLVTNA